MSESRKSFQEIIEKSLELIRQFEKVEKKKWGIEGAMIELSKQIGDLSKKVMSLEGYYFKGREKFPGYRVSREEVGDELSDILLMVIRIADHYKIDLEKQHLHELEIAISSLFTRIKKRIKGL